MTDHYDPIVSIDSNTETGLYASASNNSCVLRVSSNNKYFLTIKPEFPNNVKYRIYRVLISPRGYLIIQARSLFKGYDKDMVIVYTINGEEVCRRELDECVNDMLLDTYGYHIVNYYENFRLQEE